MQHRTGTFLGAHELDKDTYLPTYTLITKAVASARDEERFVERRRELLQKGLARLGMYVSSALQPHCLLTMMQKGYTPTTHSYQSRNTRPLQPRSLRDFQ